MGSQIARAAEEGAAADGEHDEEGHIELSAEQIAAAGIQLAQARAQTISLGLPFPGEVRFDEDRTAHVVPRVPGVVEAVAVNLGQTVKKGQLLAVIASQQISDQRSEQAAAQRRARREHRDRRRQRGGLGQQGAAGEREQAEGGGGDEVFHVGLQGDDGMEGAQKAICAERYTPVCFLLPVVAGTMRPRST